MKLLSIFSQRVLKTSDSLSKKAYTFGRFRFDAEARLLFVDGRSAPLPPKALALLQLLIQERGQLVEKEILMKALWPGTFVAEGNLTQHISTLRKTLGDGVIETVPRRGYRFVAEVEEVSTASVSFKGRWLCAAAVGAAAMALVAGMGFQRRAQASRQRQTEAYELSMKGSSCLFDKRTPDGVQRAMGYFEQARQTDPNCASAWAGLAYCYSTGRWSGVEIPPREAMRKARMAAEHALQLDPQLPYAHTALAEVQFRYEWDWAGAEREFRTALALNPRESFSHSSYGILLAVLGRQEEALDQLNQAQQLEPLSPFIRIAVGWTLNLLRRPDQAIETLNKALELDPGYTRAHQYMQEPYLAKGMYDEAVAEAVKGSPTLESAAALRQGYEREGARGFSRAWSALAASNPVTQARFAARMGQADECFRWLERAYEERHPEMPIVARYLDLDPLRGDPRFVALMRRMGLPSSTPASPVCGFHLCASPSLQGPLFAHARGRR